MSSAVRMTRSRTRRLRLLEEPSQIPPETDGILTAVDLNNNLLSPSGGLEEGVRNSGKKSKDIHSQNSDRSSVEPATTQETEPETETGQQVQHQNASWTFFKVCNKLLQSFGSLLTSATSLTPRLRWKSKSASSSSLPSLLTLLIVFILFLFIILSFCCTNVGAVCVWQGGGGFRLACGFKQSGLFRLRSLGGLKGWAGAGFTIGDEDGFKDSLSNVDPQSQQRTGAAPAGASNSKGKSLQRVGRYAGNARGYPSTLTYGDPRYGAMLSHPQQHYQQNYGGGGGAGGYSYPRLPLSAASSPTAAPKKSSLFENWKWPSLTKKKSLSTANAPLRQQYPGPIMNNPQLGHQHQRYGMAMAPAHAPAPAPAPGYGMAMGMGPAPAPGAVPMSPQQISVLKHYQQQLLAAQAAQGTLYNGHNGLLQQRQGAAAGMPVPVGIPVPMPLPGLGHAHIQPTIPSNFPSFAPMPDFPALDDEPESGSESAPIPSTAPATAARQKGAQKPDKKPYGLELLEKSPNYGKKYKIRPPNPDEVAENTLTSPAGPLGYDTDVFPDIYFTTTSKADKMKQHFMSSSTPGSHDLDLDHTTFAAPGMKKHKLKKIRLLKKGHRQSFLRQKLFNATTPADELHEFTTTLPTASKKQPKSTSTVRTVVRIEPETEEDIDDYGVPSSTTTTTTTGPTPRSRSRSRTTTTTTVRPSKSKSPKKVTTTEAPKSKQKHSHKDKSKSSKGKKVPKTEKPSTPAEEEEDQPEEIEGDGPPQWQQYSPVTPPRPRIPTPHPRNTEPPLRPDYGEEIEYSARKGGTTHFGHTNHLKIRPEISMGPEMLPGRRRPGPGHHEPGLLLGPGPAPQLPGFGHDNYDADTDDEPAHEQNLQRMYNEAWAFLMTSTTEAPSAMDYDYGGGYSHSHAQPHAQPHTGKVYDPRYPPNHEVNRGAMMPSSPGGRDRNRFPFVNPSTVVVQPTTEAPFYSKSNHFNPQTHFSRKSNQGAVDELQRFLSASTKTTVTSPLNDEVGSFIKFDSGESMQMMNLTKSYNSKFYSHFNKSAGAGAGGPKIWSGIGQQNSFSSRSSGYPHPIMNNYDYYGTTPSSSSSSGGGSGGGSWERSHAQAQQTNEWLNRHAHHQGSPHVDGHGHGLSRWSSPEPPSPTYSQSSNIAPHHRNQPAHHNQHRYTQPHAMSESREDSLESRLKSPTPPTPLAESYNYWRNPTASTHWLSQDHAGPIELNGGHHKYDRRLGQGPVAEFVTDNTFTRIPPPSPSLSSGRVSSGSSDEDDEFPTNSNRKVQFLPEETVAKMAAAKKAADAKAKLITPAPSTHYSSTPSFQEWKGYVESVGSSGSSPSSNSHLRDKDLYTSTSTTTEQPPSPIAVTPRAMPKPKPPAVLRYDPNLYHNHHNHRTHTTPVPYHDSPDMDTHSFGHVNQHAGGAFDAYDAQLVSPRPGSHRFGSPSPTPRPFPPHFTPSQAHEEEFGSNSHSHSHQEQSPKNKFKIIVIDNIENESEKSSLIKHYSSTAAPFMVSPSTMVFDNTGGAAISSTGRTPGVSSTMRIHSSSSSTFGPIDRDDDDLVASSSARAPGNHIEGDVMDPIENLHQEIKKLTAQSNSVLNEYLSEYQAGVASQGDDGFSDREADEAHRRRLEQFEVLRQKFEEQQAELMRLRNPSSTTRRNNHVSPSTPSPRPPHYSQQPDYEYEGHSSSSTGRPFTATPSGSPSPSPSPSPFRQSAGAAAASSREEIIMDDYVSRRPYNNTAGGRRGNGAGIGNGGGRRKSTTFQPVTITNHDVDKTTLAPIPAANMLPPILGPMKPYVPDTILGPPGPPVDFPTAHLNDFEDPMQQRINNQLETDWELYSISGVRPVLPTATPTPRDQDRRTLVEINRDDDNDDASPSPSMMAPHAVSSTGRPHARTRMPPPRNNSPIQPSSYFTATPPYSTSMKSVSPVRHMLPGGSSAGPGPSPTPQVMIREDGSVSFSSSMRPPPPPSPPSHVNQRRKIVRVSPTPTPTPTAMVGSEFDVDPEEEIERRGHEGHEHEAEVPYFENSSPGSLYFDGAPSPTRLTSKTGLPSSTIRYMNSNGNGAETGRRRSTTTTTEKPKSERETILKALETLSQAKSEIVESIVSEKFGGELPGEVIKIVPSLPSHLQKLTTTTTTSTTTSTTTTPAPTTTTTRRTPPTVFMSPSTPQPRKRINPPSPTPNQIQNEIANKLASFLDEKSKSSVVVLDKQSPSPSPSAYPSPSPSPSGPSPTRQSYGDIKIPGGDNVHVIELDLPDTETASAHGLSSPSPTLQSMIASALDKFQKGESMKSSTPSPRPFVSSSTMAPKPQPTQRRPYPSPSPSPSPSAPSLSGPSSMYPSSPSGGSGPSPTAPSGPSSTGQGQGQGQHPLAHKLQQMGLLQKLSANNLSSTQVETIRKLIKLHQIEQNVDNAFTSTSSPTTTHRSVTPTPIPGGQVVFSSPSSPYEIIKVDGNMDLNKLLGNLLQQQSNKIVHKAISNAHAQANQSPPPAPAATPAAMAASNVQNRVIPISPSMMSFVGNLNNLHQQAKAAQAQIQAHHQQQQQQEQQRQQQQQHQLPPNQLNHRIVNMGGSHQNNLFGGGMGVGPSQFPPQMQHQQHYQQRQQQHQLPFPMPTIGGAHTLNNGLIQVQNQNSVPLPQMIQIPPGTQGQNLQQLINQQIHQQQQQAHILNNPTLKALQALALNRAQNVKPSPQILFPQQVAPGGEPVFVNDEGGLESAASEHAGTGMVAGTPSPDDYVDLSALIGLGGPSVATLLKRNARLPTQRITNIRNAPKSYHPSRDTGIIGGLDATTAELSFDPLPFEMYTTFQCSDQKYFPGLYADTSNSCEVFHLCAKTETGYMTKSFRCPRGTVFDQEVLRCNWNLYVDCPNAQSKYYFNKYVSQSFQFLKTLGEFSASYQKA